MAFYEGEQELRAKRKMLIVLQDEMKRVFDAARDLSLAFRYLIDNDRQGFLAAIERIRRADDDVEAIRRAITREITETGSMLMNREDFLRATYSIEEVASYIEGVAFRMTQIDHETIVKAGIAKELTDLIDLTVESVQRLNEVVRALPLNPLTAVDLANNVQKLEREIDNKYRLLLSTILHKVESSRDVIILKDVLEEVEYTADRCLSATDSIVILSLAL